MTSAVGHTPATAPADDAARWETAAQIRRDHPGWVVIWVAHKGEYRARPLFRAPPETVASGTTPDELVVRMDEIRRAADRPKRPART